MPEPKNPTTVWLIEDSRIFRRGVVRAIGRAGEFRCTGEFGSAEDAVKVIGTMPSPDVVLLDLGLPGMNGLEAIRAFRERLPEARIIVLTVFHDDDKIYAAVLAGATGYLLKTGSIHSVLDALREAVSGGSPLSPTVATRILSRFALLHETGQPAVGEYGLSPRECEVLRLLSEGFGMKEIAAQLQLSLHTVVNHMRAIYRKLHVSTNTAAVSKAIRERII